MFSIVRLRKRFGCHYLFFLVLLVFSVLITDRIVLAKSETRADTGVARKESAHKESAHGQGDAGHEAHSAEKEEIFSIIPDELMESFKPVTDAYRNENLERAILETKHLMEQEGAVGETAAFLLGDMYLKQGGENNKKAFSRFLDSQEQAIRKYPRSENAAKAIMRRGTFYFDQKRYYTALDYFKMLREYPSHAEVAHVKMAQAFQALEKWNKVIDTYVTLTTRLISSAENHQIVKLVSADALYQLGQFEEAYRQYKDAISKMPDYYLNDPKSAFQYGELAYRAGDYAVAKTALNAFYQRYPLDPGAMLPMALARISNIARMDGDAELTQRASNLVYTMKPDRAGVRAAKIMLSTGKLASMSCPNPCSSAETDDSLRHIEKEANRIFLETPAPSVTTQGAIFDWLVELKRTSHFDIAEEVDMKYIASLPAASLYRPSAEGLLAQTVQAHFESLDPQDPEKIIAFYKHFQRHFPSYKMRGEDGLKIAKSYLSLGRLSEALHLFRPISSNVQSPASEEALYQVGTLLAQLGSYDKARYALEEYRNRYPKNHAILDDLGEVYSRQGETESAIYAYQEWLRHHPKDPNRKKIYQKISDAYQGKKDWPNLIKTYQDWIRDIPEELDRPYLKLADAYFQQQEHKKALESYQMALKLEKKQANRDWAMLRMAVSHRAIGNKAEGEKITQELTKKAKNKLIKQVASEQIYD